MGTYRLANQSTGVKIEYRGLAPNFVVRHLFAVFLALLAGITFTLVFQQLAPKLPEDWFLRFDWLWRIAVYLLIFLVPLLLILYTAASIVSSMHCYWKTISFDFANDRLTAINPGWWGFGKVKIDCPLSSLVMIDAAIGSEGSGPLDLELTFGFFDGESRSVQFSVPDVDKRPEAMDLLFRIGRAASLTHFSIEKNDVEDLGVCLTQYPDDGMTLIPELTQAPRYDLDQTSTSFVAPTPAVAKFDSEQYRSMKTKLEQWKPGDLVRFRRPAATWDQLLIVGVGAGLLIACLYFFNAGDQPLFDRIVPTSLTFGGVFFVTATLYRLSNCQRVVEMNWNSNLLSWKKGWLSNHKRLQQITGVVLKGTKQTHSRKNGPSWTEYHCKLALSLDSGKRIHVTGNDQWTRSSSAQRKKLEPLAASLAGSLSVPWNWIDYDEAPGQKFFVNVFFSIALLGIIGVLSFFAYAMFYQFQTDNNYEELAQKLRDSGWEITTRTDVYVGNQNIIGNGWVIKSTDSQFGDAELAELLQYQSEFPLYGMDLSGTQITDEGIKALIGEDGPWFLNVRDTKITPAAMAALAQSKVSLLDVRDTSIQLENLVYFQGLYALNALYISDNDISDSDKQLLRGVPYLSFVLVNDETTTRTLLKETHPGAGMFDLQVAPPPNYDSQ